MKKIIITFLFTSLIFVLGFSLLPSSIYQKYLGIRYNTFWSDSKSPLRLYNHSVAEKSNISWSTGNHTAAPLPIGAVGPTKYTSQFNGVIQNTKIADVMKEAVKNKVNVILVIGDGFGVNHMSLSIYKNIASGSGEKTNFEKIMNEGESGLVLTNMYDGIVTGSSGAATAIACGKKTNISMVGVDHQGIPLESVLDVAESLGLVTGLITRASIIDGTPAGFYANHKSRHSYDNIASQLAEEYNIEILFGGGAEFFIPKGTKLSDFKEYKTIHHTLDKKSKRDDERNLLYEMKNKGYKLICNNAQLKELNNPKEKVIGLFSADGLNATVDLEYEKTGEPSLLNMAEKGLELLSQNESGFFAMIEAARIDWESHDNDVGAVALAVEEMDKVLEICYNFYRSDPENTLLIFTGDHETGGLSISYNHFKNGYKRTKTLINGDQWESSINNLPFENYNKLFNQKRSLHKILGQTTSVEELYNEMNNNMAYQITMEEAQMIFELKKNYKKSK